MGRDEHAAALTLKPRAYYAAKHWWQRARMVRGRVGSREGGWRGVRLLGYHRVSDDDDELAVSPRRFRQHMQTVVAGASPVGLEQALELLADGSAAGGRYVCVTFDDAYHDNLEHAEPVLRDLGIPATIFVPTAVIDGAASFSWYRVQPPLLGWDELRDLAAGPLVSLGAHTRTHRSLTILDEAAARDEIAGSRRELEARIGRPVTTFCYPAGRFGAREERLVAEAGFSAGVSCEPGVNLPGQPTLALRRTMVDRRDGALDFRAKLAGALDRPSRLRERLHARRSAPVGP